MVSTIFNFSLGWYTYFENRPICYRAPGAEQVGEKIMQIRPSVPEISRVKV